MFAFLRGQFLDISPTRLVVDVNGVGYEVNISLNTYGGIQGKSEGLLYTHLVIREDAQVLYGFSEPVEKEMFTNLIGVSGIGAATARMMLSYMQPTDLARCIVQGDVRSLEKVKGIGKKTAERLVLELKDKLGKGVAEVNISPLIHNTLHQDALEALTALGIPRNTASQAIEKVRQAEPEISVEALIKKALRGV
ncbi:MAG: Holliday junction branch migration protein RuvA [Bacteroidota bacterium]